MAISAGARHTCALLDNGTVRCWGLAGDGLRGYGNTTTIGDDETPGGVGPLDLEAPVAFDDAKALAEDAPATTIKTAPSIYRHRFKERSVHLPVMLAFDTEIAWPIEPWYLKPPNRRQG